MSFHIGNRPIGDGAACFVIAEAGVNHNGELARAHALVDAAADAGADAVKFQTFVPDRLTTPTAATAAYQRDRDGSIRTQIELLSALRLPDDGYPGLMRHAEERGLVFLSTPFDASSAAMLIGLGAAAVKVSSGDVTNLPFLACLARAGRPIVLSTGMATEDEIQRAVDTIRANGAPPLALLHCVSCYPTPAADVNLRAMDTMRRRFAVPVGWSDHTLGTAIAVAAAARGADIIEKHLTIDRTLPGPDHAASLEPGEFRAMVAAIREVALALGDGVKRPRPIEAPIAALVRRSLHWRCDLPAGHAIEADDFEALRPNDGVAPEHAGRIVGRRLARRAEAGAPVLESDLGAARA